MNLLILLTTLLLPQTEPSNCFFDRFKVEKEINMGTFDLSGQKLHFTQCLLKKETGSSREKRKSYYLFRLNDEDALRRLSIISSEDDHVYLRYDFSANARLIFKVFFPRILDGPHKVELFQQVAIAEGSE